MTDRPEHGRPPVAGTQPPADPYRMASWLQFGAGISVGALTNVFTSLQRTHLLWRLGAVAFFAAAAWALFRSTLIADKCIREGIAASEGRPRFFASEFGASWAQLRGSRWYVMGIAAQAAGVAMLLTATLRG
jgi:hypothetical protein